MQYRKIFWNLENFFVIGISVFNVRDIIFCKQNEGIGDFSITWKKISLSGYLGIIFKTGLKPFDYILKKNVFWY